jgi:hypothetical protein
MRFAILILVCLVCGAGCSPAPPGNASSALTADKARDALLDLLRREPDLFIGNPSAERFATIALDDRHDGTFGWGAFVINPAARTYSADLNTSGPGEAYFYSGTFEFRWRQWTANKPQVQRMHQP